MSEMRFAVVSSGWHETATQGLIAAAVKAIEERGMKYSVIRVGSSFQLPLVCKAALDMGADGVVALGVVVRGATPHFEFLADAITGGLMSVAIQTGKPVGFGVLTVNSEQQALERAGLRDSVESKGREAAESAMDTAITLQGLQ